MMSIDGLSVNRGVLLLCVLVASLLGSSCGVCERCPVYGYVGVDSCPDNAWIPKGSVGSLQFGSQRSMVLRYALTYGFVDQCIVGDRACWTPSFEDVVRAEEVLRAYIRDDRALAGRGACMFPRRFAGAIADGEPVIYIFLLERPKPNWIFEDLMWNNEEWWFSYRSNGQIVPF